MRDTSQWKKITKFQTWKNREMLAPLTETGSEKRMVQNGKKVHFGTYWRWCDSSTINSVKYAEIKTKNKKKYLAGHMHELLWKKYIHLLSKSKQSAMK